MGAMKHGHGMSLFGLCIYKLIWKKNVFKISKTKLPGAIDKKTKNNNNQKKHTWGYFNIFAVFILQKSNSCRITVLYYRNLAIYSSLAPIYLTSIRVKQNPLGMWLFSLRCKISSK